jgi:hypothetical protein
MAMGGWRSGRCRGTRWSAVVVVGALIAAGCSGSGEKESSKEVGPEGGVVVLSESVSIVVPPGVAAGGTSFEPVGPGSGPPAAAELAAASRFDEIKITSGSLDGAVLVEFAVPEVSTDPGSVTVGLHQMADGTWESVPASVDPARSVVAVETTSFSLLGFLQTSTSALRAEATKILDGLVGQVVADIALPACAGEDEARAGGWVINSDDGARVKWCFGIENGERIVRVVNGSRYPRIFRVTGATEVHQPTGSWTSALSEQVSSLAGIDNEYVANPGEAMTVDIGERKVVIESSYDGLAASLFQLQVGTELAVAFLTKFGLGERNGERYLDAAMNVTDCVSSMVPPVANGTFGSVDTGEMLRSCILPAVAGAEGGAAGAILSTLIGPVISTVTWVISSANYVADLGRDSYSVTVTPLPPPSSAGSPPCPPDIGAQLPRYVYAAMCVGNWAVVLESGCASGHSNGWIFHSSNDAWQQVGSPEAFDGWPAPLGDLAAHGVPADIAARFATAPARPSDDGTCPTWVVPPG